MMRFKLALIALAAVLFPLLYVSAPTAAAAPAGCSSKFFLIPTWYEYLPLNPAPDCSVKTKDIDGSVALLITLAIIDILLFVGGFLAGFFIIYGGFRFITSQGESGKVASARTIIANAVVGLLIVVVASRVVAYIAGKLAAKAAAGGTGGVLGNANIPNVAANGSNLSMILSFVFALTGAIALLVITIAGFRFVISQGDPAKVATARNTILYAVIGLVISVFSFTIVRFILGQV